MPDKRIYVLHKIRSARRIVDNLDGQFTLIRNTANRSTAKDEKLLIDSQVKLGKAKLKDLKLILEETEKLV